MTIHAILSDIHANLAALDAVLEDRQSLAPQSDLWVLGDTVMYGPEPIACLERLQAKQPSVFLMGNNDYEVLHEQESLSGADLADLQVEAKQDPFRKTKIETNRAVLNWTRAQLQTKPQARDYLAAAAITENRQSLQWPVVLVHASPCEPMGLTGNYLREESDAEEALLYMTKQGLDDQICFMGHTHIPVWFVETTTERIYDQVKKQSLRSGRKDRLDKDEKRRMLINPGSVGQPRNGDARAYYLLFDDQTGELKFRQVNYAIEQTVAALKRSDINNFASAEVHANWSLIQKVPTEMLADRLRKAY